LRPGRRLEDIISKRRDLPYRSRRCRAWVKLKNPASPAVLRIEDGTGEDVRYRGRHAALEGSF
jgi:ATP-dependent DNA ligase